MLLLSARNSSFQMFATSDLPSRMPPLCILSTLMDCQTLCRLVWSVCLLIRHGWELLVLLRSSSNCIQAPSVPISAVWPGPTAPQVTSDGLTWLSRAPFEDTTPQASAVAPFPSLSIAFRRTPDGSLALCSALSSRSPAPSLAPFALSLS